MISSRKPDGTYLYGWYLRRAPMAGINKPGGSSLRTQACNIALKLHGSEVIGVKELRRGLEDLVKQHRFAIAGVHRPIPHESHYAISGYFYLYGHRYASLVLEHMPDADKRHYWPEVVKAVLKTRQPDGSYWDYPLYGYHKFYGTGYALMTLARCPEAIVE